MLTLISLIVVLVLVAIVYVIAKGLTLPEPIPFIVALLVLLYFLLNDFSTGLPLR